MKLCVLSTLLIMQYLGPFLPASCCSNKGPPGPSFHPQLFQALLQRMTQKLRRPGVSSRVDDSSASIGKRYAAMTNSERHLASPSTSSPSKTTRSRFRDRDSTKQVRAQRMRSVKLSSRWSMARRPGRMSGRGCQNSKDRKWTEQGIQIISAALCLARFLISKTRRFGQKPHGCDVQIKCTQVY